MYDSHKITLHVIKRAAQSHCFIDAYCPAMVTAQLCAAISDGLGL